MMSVPFREVPGEPLDALVTLTQSDEVVAVAVTSAACPVCIAGLGISLPWRFKLALELVSSLRLDAIVAHIDDHDSIRSFSDQIHHETDAYADAFLPQYASGLQRTQLGLRVGEPAQKILAVPGARDVTSSRGLGRGRGSRAWPRPHADPAGKPQFSAARPDRMTAGRSLSRRDDDNPVTFGSGGRRDDARTIC
jgi:hypothetical protein